MALSSKRRAQTRKRPPVVSSRGVEFLPIRTWLDEAFAVIALVAAVFCLASLVLTQFYTRGGSFLPEPAVLGSFGRFLGRLLTGFFGWCSLSIIGYLVYAAAFFWRHNFEEIQNKIFPRPMQVVGGLVGIAALAAFSHVVWGRVGGGAVGAALGEPIEAGLGGVGSGLVFGGLGIYCVALSVQTSVLELFKASLSLVWLLVVAIVVGVPKLLWKLSGWIVGVVESRVSKWRKESLERRAERLAAKDEAEAAAKRERRGLPKGETLKASAQGSKEIDTKEKSDKGDEPASTAHGIDYEHDSRDVIVQRRLLVRPLLPPAPPKKSAKPITKAPVTEEVGPPVAYVRPETALLTVGEPAVGNENDDELKEMSRLIESKLKDFGILGKVTHVHPGPVITLFEFEPAPGVKVGRIVSLQDDLAMSLRAASIRILAPLPKRGTVGIEVPNRTRELVRIRDVLEHESFTLSDSILTVAVGKDTYGEPMSLDISAMPHLLIAGATGTGKSVCINTFLISLLYKATPEELGLILIDPKVLELSVYETIPHLRVPVVTVPKQAKAVLSWAATEMDRRYRFMQKFGVRNIDSYNKYVSGEGDDGKKTNLSKVRTKDLIPLPEESIVAEGTTNKKEVPELAADGVPVEELKPLPKIVIVIDELADLMLTVGRDIEELITRLAQKARAAGIHLILATQRPSVDVITGLIKANFPARVSFRVSSRIDSRTILDSMGAEKLLGKGDMLVMLPGADSLKRVHGAFISDNEVKKVIQAISGNRKPSYDQNIVQACEKALLEDQESAEGGEGADGAPAEYDSMYDKCVELVLQKGHASTSMLQRAFRLGYNRAARIVDMMEKEGVVGPMDGVRPREVLVQNKPDTEGPSV